VTHQEIKELAGHRAVSPWVMKLVSDAVEKERKACANVAAEWIRAYPHPSAIIENNILARGNK
jgi:hypothetical protein